jgi:hypothetical protein
MTVSTLRKDAVPQTVRTMFERRRTIVGPVGDFVWIWGSPILALGIIHLLLSIPSMNREITLGEDTTIVAFGLSALTFAHLLPVFLRSHLNPTIRRKYPFRFFVVPPLLIAGMALSSSALVVGGVIAGFWDVYHTAQQNFGLGRIYDARAGVADDRTRRADRLISHVLYLGPIIAGASFLEHMSEFDSVDAIGWNWLARTPENVSPRVEVIRIAAISIMAVGVVLYLFHARRNAKNGAPASIHKTVLMTTSAVIQIAAWGFSSPLVAFMTVNLYHAVQYFALVWHLEGRNVSRYLKLNARSARIPVGILVVFAVPALFGYLVNTVVTEQSWINAAFLSVSLLHFWMDGFIWSVRTKSV